MVVHIILTSGGVGLIDRIGGTHLIARATPGVTGHACNLPEFKTHHCPSFAEQVLV
jgi:hypothetical protein